MWSLELLQMMEINAYAAFLGYLAEWEEQVIKSSSTAVCVANIWSDSGTRTPVRTLGYRSSVSWLDWNIFTLLFFSFIRNPHLLEHGVWLS